MEFFCTPAKRHQKSLIWSLSTLTNSSLNTQSHRWKKVSQNNWNPIFTLKSLTLVTPKTQKIWNFFCTPAKRHQKSLIWSLSTLTNSSLNAQSYRWKKVSQNNWNPIFTLKSLTLATPKTQKFWNFFAPLPKDTKKV